MLRGVTTISLFADDVAAAQAWYAELLGTTAYFVREIDGQPAYVEFRVGDYQHELGIRARRFAPHPTDGPPGGVVVYWHVDDLATAVDQALALGATPHEDPTERGPGFVTASVVDPFGNILGLMYNAHYLDVLGTRAAP
jgi:predicted enzyme related to lactoylglutathione lyase